MKQYVKYLVVIAVLACLTLFFAFKYTTFPTDVTTEVMQSTGTSTVKPATGRPAVKTDNWITYVPARLPAYKTKGEEVLYFDESAGKLYWADLNHGKLQSIYQLEAEWELKQYNLSGDGKVIFAVEKSEGENDDYTNQVQGYIVDVDSGWTKPKLIFEREGTDGDSYYELMDLQFTYDNKFIVETASGYEWTDVILYNANTLRQVDLFADDNYKKSEGEWGISYIGSLPDSRVLLGQDEYHFYIYEMDMRTGQSNYQIISGQWVDSIQREDGVIYTIVKEENENKFFLVRMPVGEPGDGLTVLGLKGQYYQQLLLEPLTQPVTPAEVSSAEREVIEVQTVHEFINAIGSNRTILMKPGTYNLAALPADDIGGVRWDEEEGRGFLIENVQNLTIRATHPLFTEIVTQDLEANILTFLYCQNISIQGVILGHHPAGYSCSGDVLIFSHSSGIDIKESVLFGCGAVGLRLLLVNNLTMTNSVITECSDQIVDIEDSDSITFTSALFTDNNGGLSVNGTGVVIEDSEISKNNSPYPLFNVTEPNILTVKQSRVLNNQADAWISVKDSVEFIETTMENNSYDKKYQE